MNFGPLMVAALMAAATSTHHAHDSTAASMIIENNVVSVSHDSSAPRQASPSPAVGELAPDFSYQSHDYLWQNLHNILEQGSVVLVFGASEEQLRGIERDREALLAQHVVPVAVVDRRDVEAWTLVRKLNLGYSLLADPRRALGEQYGVLDSATHRSQAAWFVIDPQGHVRGSGVGTLPSSAWDELAAAALQPVNASDRTATADER